MQFFNISNHNSKAWSAEQTKAAKAYGQNIFDWAFPEIPPTATTEEVMQIAKEEIKGLQKRADATSIALIAGEQTCVVALVALLQSMGIKVVAATSERKVEPLPDGSKKVGFQFIQFREFPEIKLVPKTTTKVDAAMPCFTIEDGEVTKGLLIHSLTVGGQKFPVVEIGNHQVAVKLLGTESLGGKTRILNAKIDTINGVKQIIETAKADTDTALLNMVTPHGYRGSNSHTGDRIDSTNLEMGFQKWPGQIINKGQTDSSPNGALGSGEHLLSTMPKGKVFRTGYSGRRYGRPSAHYYIWTGTEIIAATWDERAATGIF